MWRLKVYSYNGFGGKVEPGETSLQAAHRELKVSKVTLRFLL